MIKKLLAAGDKILKILNNNLAVERVLGIWWNPSKNVFTFYTKFHKIDKDILENKRRPTKSEVLKIVMSVFSANFVVQGKMLLQHMWRSQTGMMQ